MAVQCRGMSRLQGEVEFGVLGPLEVRVAGRPVVVPGARQRALLTALLLRRGTVVAFDRLIDDVFGEQPPDEARNALQTYAARLRHALGPAAGVIVTRAPGYALEVPGDAVDLERFTVLLVRAREAQSPAAALALVEEALALWRGPAYGEFAETFARGEALRLQELRLAAREDCATLLVRLGRLAEATAALEAIVAEEPWRERAVELLVTALAQAGQARHALAAYARYRDRLRDELGLDPSPKLRRLEQQVLRAEIEPVQPSPARRASGASCPSDLLRRPGTRAHAPPRDPRLWAAGHAGRPGRGRQDPPGPPGRGRGTRLVGGSGPTARPRRHTARGCRYARAGRPAGHSAAGQPPRVGAGRSRAAGRRQLRAPACRRRRAHPGAARGPLSAPFARDQPPAARRGRRAGPGRPTARGARARCPGGGHPVGPAVLRPGPRR